jgi:hypoxanthine phosphoribosyltransferase
MPTRIYTLADTNPMSWAEFGEVMNNLVDKIRVYISNKDMTFDAIAPILRSGAIPGMVIANKLKITTILPIQVKYCHDNNRPKQLLPFLKPLTVDLGNNPKILVTECNTVTGESARNTAEIIKRVYPKAELYYASIGKVYKNPEVSLSVYSHCFVGIMTNECFEADINTINELMLRPGITIYPWETASFELEDINPHDRSDI